MCAVSAVSPNTFEHDLESKKLLKEALERLDRIDKRLNDIEWDDEAKAAFKKAVGL